MKVNVCSRLSVRMCSDVHEIVVIGACAISKTFIGEVVQHCVCRSVQTFLYV